MVADLPWVSRTDMEPDHRYLAMASHLPLKTLSSTPRFLRAVSAVRRQLAVSEGLIGYSLRAKPLACDYWTLSVWKDEAALRNFMQTPPHVQLMASLQPLMGQTKFVQWEVTAGEGRPTWTTAMERLDSS